MLFLGRRQPAHSHQLGGLRERCKLPQRGPGRSPGRRRVFLYSEPLDCISQHLSTCCIQFAWLAIRLSRGICISISRHINSWGVRSPAYPPLPTPVLVLPPPPFPSQIPIRPTRPASRVTQSGLQAEPTGSFERRVAQYSHTPHH